MDTATWVQILDETNCISRSTNTLGKGRNPICCILTFDPDKNAIPRWCTGRKWHILMAVMRGNSVGRNWLMKWDELKNSHGTLIDWCTGREWPVNCMTVISAWWRSNMRFQKSSRRLSELLYNSVKTEVRQLQLEIRRSYRQDVVGKAGRRCSGILIEWGAEKLMIRCSRSGRLISPGERDEKDTTLTAIRMGGENIAVSVRSPTPSHTQTLSNPFRTLTIMWEVHIFIKKSSCVIIIVLLWLWACNKLFSLQQWVNNWADWVLQPGWGN